ncbi:MAG: FIST C-terminal domain-containing protein [Candidatus Cloacimonetes bacterium]|nr:FIST C-terminal domain-containing protein [Candidatus Cloacimonadota bacterium]
MFQKILFYDGNNLKGWETFLNELSKDEPDGIFLFVADDTDFDYKKIHLLLKKLEIDVVGCIFPEVIYNGNSYKKGIVGCSISASISIEKINNLNEFKGNISQSLFSSKTETVMIFFDGWSDNTDLLIETLYELSGKEMTFIGGGTGSLKDTKRASLFTSEDCFTGGAIIVMMEEYMSIGIKHGLQTIDGPSIVTDIDKRILKSINWNSALEYYKTIVEKDSEKTITEENYLSIAKTYPLGMLKYDGEIIPRASLAIQDGNNILLGAKIPINSMLMIMKGYPDKIISSYEKVVKEAQISFKNKNKKTPSKTLIIDCICRTIFLDDQHKEALKLIWNEIAEKSVLFGFLSLGEVASIGDKYIELYNNTIVIGMGE